MIDYNKHCANMDLYPDLDEQGAARRMAQALTYRTVSYEDESQMDGEQFLALHKHLENSFPGVHKVMQRTVVNKWSLLYKWPHPSGVSDASLQSKAVRLLDRAEGSETPEGCGKPILFMSHLDVVPAAADDEWLHPAFGGEIADGCVWGRGAIDTKSMAMAELEAAEYLINCGFTPSRDIYFCFGHDEETMGQNGTYSIMQLLKQQGVVLDFVIDEGVPFEEGEKYGAPGVLLACVGVCEKGYLDMEVVANDPGGHSSKPGERTALGETARAVAAIEDAKFPAGICEPLKQFYRSIRPSIKDDGVAGLVDGMEEAPEALADYLLQQNWSAAMVRTTTAATMAQASPAPNVLPQQARMLFNFRTMPGDSLDYVLEHCRAAAAEFSVDIRQVKGMEASGVSRVDTPAFALLKQTIEDFFPTAIAAPYILAGATDARYFEEICECVYRFRPFIAEMLYRDTVHAANERMDITSYIHGVKFFINLIERDKGHCKNM